MSIIKSIFIFLSFAVLTACGGGGGSGGSNPNQPIFFTTAGTSVILPVAKSEQFDVGGGVPPYSVSTNDQAIAVGAISGNKLTLGAVAPGTATVSVFDSSGAAIRVSVRVGASTPLYTTASSSITIGVGSVASRIFTIGGGVAPYTVSGTADAVARVESLNGTQWKVTGITIGTTNVRIRDFAGVEVQVSVTVGAPELRVSPADLKLFPGLSAIVKISGGQPPYRIAGGIPAAVDAQISQSNPDELVITGKLASDLELSVADATGQLQKVTVKVEIGQAAFGISPSTLSVSETDSQLINLTIYGAAPGRVCLFTSDTAFLQPVGNSCKTVIASGTPITVDTGTSGSRCVNGEREVTITAVDASGSIGTAVITILDNDLACGLADFTVSPDAITVRAAVGAAPATSNQALISGGSGSYVVVSSNSAAATAAVAGNVITVTGGTVASAVPVIITVIDQMIPGRSDTISVTVN